MPSAYLGSRLCIYLPLQTLHLVSGAKYPLLLFSGFTFQTTVLFCVAHSFVTTSFQSQKHIKPAWSRLLTCTPCTTPSGPLPQPQGIQVAEMQMEDFLRSCNKHSHGLACSSRTWQRRELLVKMTLLERPSRCRPTSTTRLRCNYKNNCSNSVKTLLQSMLCRRL